MVLQRAYSATLHWHVAVLQTYTITQAAFFAGSLLTCVNDVELADRLTGVTLLTACASRLVELMWSLLTLDLVLHFEQPACHASWKPFSPSHASALP